MEFFMFHWRQWTLISHVTVGELKINDTEAERIRRTKQQQEWQNKFVTFIYFFIFMLPGYTYVYRYIIHLWWSRLSLATCKRETIHSVFSIIYI